MTALEYRVPETLEEAYGLLEEYGDDGRVISGGTALVILMRQKLVRPACLIQLGRLAELRGLEDGGAGLSIGAMTTHREAELSPVVADAAPALVETLRHVATIRIRNAATVGGNLAHADPALDPPVTLMALDASVRLDSRGGSRRVPLDEFFVDHYETVMRPDEILTRIDVPKPRPRTEAAFLKFLPRSSDDYATVAVAVRLTVDEAGGRCEDVRITLGSVGSTTLRARAAEAVLQGQPLNGAALREAASLSKDVADPIADIRGSAEYKRDMVEVFVRRALLRALDRLGARVVDA
jgi:carbon-monoxide dehydrogenase medium subunit